MKIADLKKILKVFLTLQWAKELPRQGFIAMGFKRNEADSVAAHSFSTSILSYFLAKQLQKEGEKIDPEKALSDVKNKPLYQVPLHLRNAPTNLMKEIGYGKEYKYPHDFEHHFIEENYLPEELKNQIYYEPTEQGQEKNLKERLKNLWKNRKKY